jgi:dihydroorotase
MFLIKQTRILAPGFDAQTRYDIRIHQGVIVEIGQGLSPQAEEVIEHQGLCTAPGWFDTFAFVGEPGLEDREDFTTAAAAAKAGGFTELICLPNTKPALQGKSQIQYIVQHSGKQGVAFHPMGAISDDCAGKDIAELYDMREAGAIAFGDGKNSLQHSGMMLRALLYVKAFGGLVVNQCQDNQLIPGGQMHEGPQSTALGLRGIPDLAESMMVQRDLDLLEYTNSRLHIANVSAARSLALIRAAKAKGLQVTCSVAPLNLAFNDEVLHAFDSNFKVQPPLRTEADRLALIEALQDGTIDIINSNHIPLDEESKKLEFTYASFGAIGLETAFALSQKALAGHISLEKLVDLFSVQSRRVFGLEVPNIAVGAHANLTLFVPETTWTYDLGDIQSKSKNSPLIGLELQGKVIRTIYHKTQ